MRNYKTAYPRKAHCCESDRRKRSDEEHREVCVEGICGTIIRKEI